MAVFTPLSRAQILDFLEDYDLGTLESFEGIKQGTDNTNYHVWTNKGHYILTLFEKRIDPADLPFYFGFTDHLVKKGIRCPHALPDREGNTISFLADRPAALISFLDGAEIKPTDINPDHCTQVGDMVGCMHAAVKDFTMQRPNTTGLARWQALAEKTKARADEVEPGLAALIAAELDYIAKNWDKADLPRGAIHADIFTDNVFFRVGSLYGIIDFYFACTEYLAYDLAITVNVWCFDTAHRFKPERYKALMDAYAAVRPLSAAEKQHFNLMCRAASLRFLMTRLHDWLFHDPAHFVTPKDPREYLTKLKFHQNETIIDS